MASSNLGRVQGGGFFGSSATSTTSITKTTVQTNGVSPLVGDTIVNANGDLCKITAITSSAYTVTKYGSIKGATGAKGADGTNGKDGKDAADFSDVKFATSDWECIMDVIMAGKAAEVFKLTDKREIEFGNGNTLELSILDLSGRHDVMSSDESTLVPNGFAPITLGIMMTTGDYYAYDSSGSSNKWETSALRTETMPALMDMLPEEIKQYIVPVIKYTQTGETDIKIIKTVEKCFPLSLAEVMGDCTARIVADGNLYNASFGAEPYTLEGKQYDYFKAVQDGETGEGRVLYDPNGNIDRYWTRTPCADDGYGVIYVDPDLIVYPDNVSNEYGVPFGFCVSK